MEEDLVTPTKTKEESGSVLLTYFQGDVNSMVDEHFTRALNQAAKPKEEPSRIKRKNGFGLNPWEAQTRLQPMFPSDHLASNHHMSPNHPVNPIWSGDSRQGLGLALPSVMYPSAMPSEGLVMPEHQYSNSLLHLLHNERPDMSTGWTKYPGFGDQMTCDMSVNSGVQVIEKKDLYWY